MFIYIFVVKLLDYRLMKLSRLVTHGMLYTSTNEYNNLWRSSWQRSCISQNNPASIIFLTATCPRTESTLKTYFIHLIQNIYYIKTGHFQKAPHFGSHLGNHLDIFINFNEVSLVPFKILQQQHVFQKN